MRQIKKELLRFIAAGCGAVGTDTSSYFLLLNSLSPNIAKAISFLLGTIVSYLINKYWTFEKQQKSYTEAGMFLLLYLSTLLVNVATNRFVLTMSSSVVLAFFIATGLSTLLNFIGQKWWVFKQKQVK